MIPNIFAFQTVTVTGAKTGDDVHSKLVTDKKILTFASCGLSKISLSFQLVYDTFQQCTVCKKANVKFKISCFD